ncbi:hypothetical protein J421_4373 [Gemmatirosa kalamazoonensis]|uniref:Uncharacterized protein n=2 Tax=Gemmatirosa kalamazoonensis TaxID=861299 RepID=W0RNK3_9BACT|nr:hypothetical protein J421_4373 [Gemmatirosa kalamazoonensis]
MEHEPTDGIGEAALGAERVPTTGRPAPISSAHLHDTLARFAATMAATATPPRGTDLRGRARTFIDAAAGRRVPTPTTRREARDVVAAYAAQLRADGTPPERMLIVLKAAVRDATPGVLDQAQLHALTADVVRWSIEGFYSP